MIHEIIFRLFTLMLIRRVIGSLPLIISVNFNRNLQE
jgi:hypothetical protein